MPPLARSSDRIGAMPDHSLTAQVHTLDDASCEAVFEFAAEQGWTDGLPILPPTAESVRRMVAGSRRQPQELVAALPPQNAPATVEKIAVNAVMAGCRPEYMPLVITSIEACVDPDFNLYSLNATTSSVSPLLIVNGPVRQELAINCGYSLFGGGNFRANATIGRAVRLCMRNIGGAIEGIVSKSTMGQAGRLSACIGEWEERSPWPPLHVQRGLELEQSAVTVFGSQGTLNLTNVWCKTAEGLLTVLAHSLDSPATNMLNGASGSAELLLVLCPDFAHLIARDGWSVTDVKEFIYQRTKAIPLSRFPQEMHGQLDELGRIHNGVVPLAASPDQFIIVVGGGLGGLHAVACHPFAYTKAVTRALPA